jgi:hypothetical protein
VADGSPLNRMCHHCGASNVVRFGECHVCAGTVCERCGNVQYIKGERKVVHDDCLEQTSDSFSMIKFVK